eukprot:Opistho-2@14629
MPLKIVTASGRTIAEMANATDKTTAAEIKAFIQSKNKKLYPDRQMLRLEPRGKALGDNEAVGKTTTLYFKDLGPQIGWATVFLAEYAGPLFVYLLFAARPALIYGEAASKTPLTHVQQTAAACWAFHYAKRVLETIFVHRFSHGTMPIFNLFKNCSYYWGFAAFIAYFVNHPLFTAPGEDQVKIGLALFAFAELGNFSIHIALRNLRPAGSKVRRIPFAGANPFTWLFGLVSCPNYTYEAIAWTGFSIMTQSLSAVIFTIAGLVQMSVWALGKHRNYKKEFGNEYPRGRKAILPFLV